MDFMPSPVNVLAYSKAKRYEADACRPVNGGLAGTRTLDQCLKRALLYQLSYQPNRVGKNKWKPQKSKVFPAIFPKDAGGFQLIRPSESPDEK